MNDLTFYGDSWDHYLYWQSQDKKTLRKINSLLNDKKEMVQCMESESRSR